VRQRPRQRNVNDPLSYIRTIEIKVISLSDIYTIVMYTLRAYKKRCPLGIIRTILTNKLNDLRPLVNDLDILKVKKFVR